MPNVLEQGWVGRRVTVRRVLGRTEQGRTQYGDVVGDLLRLDARVAVIDTRHGPVEAIFYEDDLPEKWRDYTQANVDFFDELGSPGGASKVGKTDNDPEFIRSLPAQEHDGH